MSYDVTNKSSIVELGSTTTIPSSVDLTPIVLPTTLPTQQLVGMDSITPTGDTITIPTVVPKDGVVLLESIQLWQPLLELEAVTTFWERNSLLGTVYPKTTTDNVQIPTLAGVGTRNVLVDESGILTIGTVYVPYVFEADITVVLSDDKSLGKYVNGDTIPAIGLTAAQVLIDIATDYIVPAFTSFSVASQDSTVEVGTLLTGIKTFNWAITDNSGTVAIIDIYDITDSSDLETDIANTGTKITTLTDITLNSNGSTQQWRGVGTDSTPDPDADVNSATVTVTSRYKRFYGNSATSATTSALVRALPTSEFQTGSDEFTLWTGTVQSKFIVALPPDVTITEVVDTDALYAVLTDEYVLQGTVAVDDIGGTPRTYNVYEMSMAIPYEGTHRHVITTLQS